MQYAKKEKKRLEAGGDELFSFVRFLVSRNKKTTPKKKIDG